MKFRDFVRREIETNLSMKKYIKANAARGWEAYFNRVFNEVFNINKINLKFE